MKRFFDTFLLWQNPRLKFLFVRAAAVFYQDKQLGLEQRFLDVLVDALRRIQRLPLQIGNRLIHKAEAKLRNHVLHNLDKYQVVAR